MHTVVNTRTHPALTKALSLLFLDKGSRPLDEYELHETPEQADHAEKGLALLSDEELETFVTGEESERKALNKAHHLGMAEMILEGYFEG
jgi:hypothetical protein